MIKDFNNTKIHSLGNGCLHLFSDSFDFMYQIADKVVKDEFKGEYEYLGGLQCSYEKWSIEYKELEEKLVKYGAFLEVEESFYESKRIVADFGNSKLDLGNYVGIDNLK